MLPIDYNSIKAEIQGNNGLMKLLKKEILPTTEKMAALAQSEFVEKLKPQKFEDVDLILDDLLTTEYTIFQRKETEILFSVIELADKYSTKEKFPNIRTLIDSVKEELSKGENPLYVAKHYTPIFFAAIESNRQSKVTRAGHSLMHHLDFLFQKNSFEKNSDYKKNIKVEAYPLDFFFPNIENYKNDPLNCCAIACQTTINDKVKKVESELPNNVRRRVCTAIGSANFGDGAVKDLSGTRLAEAYKENYKFVVLEKAFLQNPSLKDSNSVMTYKQLFEEIKKLKPLWI